MKAVPGSLRRLDHGESVESATESVNGRLQVNGYQVWDPFDGLSARVRHLAKGRKVVGLGVPVIERTVDSRCFVDRRAFADDGELLSSAPDMPESEYRESREAARAWLASTTFPRHLSEVFADTVCGTLGLGAAGGDDTGPGAGLVQPTLVLPADAGISVGGYGVPQRHCVGVFR